MLLLLPLLSSSNFLGVVFFWNFGFHLLIFILLWFSTLTKFIAEDGENFVSTFIVVIVVGDVDFIVVDVILGSAFIMDTGTVVIIDSTVGSVIDSTVVIVVRDVNDIVGNDVDFIVVIVVCDWKMLVVTVVSLLSFLLLL